MSWATPNTWATNDVPSAAQLNQDLRDNPNYLLSGRPNSQTYRNNSANYTTTSTSFVDIDGTNLIITLTVTSGKVLVYFFGRTTYSATSSGVDLAVDGVRQGASFTDGLVGSMISSYYVVLVTGLSVGSHTFKPQWRTISGTATLVNTGTGTVCPVIFGAFEVG